MLCCHWTFLLLMTKGALSLALCIDKISLFQLQSSYEIMDWKILTFSFNCFRDPLSPDSSSISLAFLHSLGWKYWNFLVLVLILFLLLLQRRRLLLLLLLRKPLFTISFIPLAPASTYMVTSQTVAQIDLLSFRVINLTTYLTVPLEVMWRNFPH